MRTPEATHRITEAGEQAEQYRRRGFSCSEAVLRGAAAALGIELEQNLLRASTGLRGGGGGYGDRCGALEGGALLIGLVYGRVEPEEDNSCASQLVHWLHERFTSTFGSTACRVLKPLAYEQSDDFSCGPLYRWGAELVTEAILTAPALCPTCPPYRTDRGGVERVPVDMVALQEMLVRVHTLAGSSRVMISEAAHEAQGRLGVTDEEVIFSLVNAGRVRPAWGGTYVVEGRKPDRWWLASVVRIRPDGGTEALEVLTILA